MVKFAQIVNSAGSFRHSLRRATFLSEEGFDLIPLKRVYEIIAWLAGKYTMHLCAADSIRAMPENKNPPTVRVDFYL